MIRESIAGAGNVVTRAARRGVWGAAGVTMARMNKAFVKESDNEDDEEAAALLEKPETKQLAPRADTLEPAAS